MWQLHSACLPTAVSVHEINVKHEGLIVMHYLTMTMTHDAKRSTLPPKHLF